jgi:hypothetical protein
MAGAGVNQAAGRQLAIAGLENLVRFSTLTAVLALLPTNIFVLLLLISVRG